MFDLYMEERQYKKMGSRLKELRTTSGLSHDKLAAKLGKEMGVRISRDSLINYENKPDKCPGMKIEYLLAFSALYGVSTDYILGISDHKSTSEDAQNATNYVGLSEEIVSTLYAASHIDKIDSLQAPLSKSATDFLEQIDFSPFDKSLAISFMLSFCESLISAVFEDPVLFGQYLCHLNYFVGDNYDNNYRPADEVLDDIQSHGFALLPVETYLDFVADKIFDVLKERVKPDICK
jgi:transcriptional regulator with XRE-family HTH domain